MICCHGPAKWTDGGKGIHTAACFHLLFFEERKRETIEGGSL